MKPFAHVLLHSRLFLKNAGKERVCLLVPAYEGHLATDLLVVILASGVLFKTAVKRSPSLQHIHQRQGPTSRYSVKV